MSRAPLLLLALVLAGCVEEGIPSPGEDPETPDGALPFRPDAAPPGSGPSNPDAGPSALPSPDAAVLFR